VIGHETATGVAGNVSATPPRSLDAAAAPGTVLAFDCGERFVGVAVGESGVRVAHPLTTIDTRVAAARFQAIAALVDAWRPTQLVVGLPLGLAGDPHDLTRRAERFARQLAARFRLPVALVDERLSSAEAADRLRVVGRGGRRSKRLVHPVSAQVILQDFFDRHAAA
jgi:putative Holliday junction resolvase